MKNMRIVSDGTALGTKVFDADGVEINGCLTKIEWSIESERRVGAVTLTYECVEIDAVGEADG
jgi:hypothetical protein